jgi:hypothetical protein
MLRLHDVTLVVIESRYPYIKLTEDSVRRTLSLVEFDDILLFSGHTFMLPAPTIRVDIHSSLDAQKLYWSGVRPYLKTSHALFAHWDSWVVNPDCWQDEFMQCDWLGARWSFHKPPHNVGNGGFSLRSKRLMDVLETERDRLPVALPEDDAICRRYRPYLEQNYNLRWGTEEQAMRFANESDNTEPLGFGFHAVWNFPSALTEDDCITVFKELPPSLFSPDEQFIAWCRAQQHNKHQVLHYLNQLPALQNELDRKGLHPSGLTKAEFVSRYHK